ncbi:hypothetical protein MtrunA17_Chr1g0162261 [Medicago truncatula]|uniref:Uncharacterized protein n=1 Tax=Medicago truncatula TaxID=3880 RepID=A0A072VH11_MEDTR|nr:uncharacterized protein LOC25482650 [Medicago truncatula]KEH40733.1 hypothetical protein MTR_1g033930 [Medicago truncatula]RHN78142.1 hypothetical protein MtrunA17_Chr1g0162261 [Medicago truncatula]
MTGRNGKHVGPKRKKGGSKKVANQVIEGNTSSSVIDEMNYVNQQNFILQRIAEAMSQLEKKRKENRENELNLLMMGCMHNPNMLANLKTAEDSNDFAEVVDKKLNEVDTKIDELNRSDVI